MQNLLAVTKALSDPNRVRILMMLRGRELCLCQITAVLDLAPSTVSKHMALLAGAGLVTVRQAGRWRFFQRPDRGTSEAVARGLSWIDESLQGDALLERDAHRLTEVLEVPVDVICSRVRPARGRAPCGGRKGAVPSSRGESK